MEVILLEKVNKLGNIGETVNVKTGYARNFLLPQKKALRATEDNKAYYETQRATIEKQNAAKRGEAEKQLKTLEGTEVALIRAAAEDGRLYGSVTSRDVHKALSEQGVELQRSQVVLDQAIKTTGEFSAVIELHPEVSFTVPVRVGRSENEINAFTTMEEEEETAEAADTGSDEEEAA